MITTFPYGGDPEDPRVQALEEAIEREYELLQKELEDELPEWVTSSMIEIDDREIWKYARQRIQDRRDEAMISRWEDAQEY